MAEVLLRWHATEAGGTVNGSKVTTFYEKKSMPMGNIAEFKYFDIVFRFDLGVRPPPGVVFFGWNLP